jgi:hypothetical protein
MMGRPHAETLRRREAEENSKSETRNPKQIQNPKFKTNTEPETRNPIRRDLQGLETPATELSYLVAEGVGEGDHVFLGAFGGFEGGFDFFYLDAEIGDVLEGGVFEGAEIFVADARPGVVEGTGDFIVALALAEDALVELGNVFEGIDDFEEADVLEGLGGTEAAAEAFLAFEDADLGEVLEDFGEVVGGDGGGGGDFADAGEGVGAFAGNVNDGAQRIFAGLCEHRRSLE